MEISTQIGFELILIITISMAQLNSTLFVLYLFHRGMQLKVLH